MDSELIYQILVGVLALLQVFNVNKNKDKKNIIKKLLQENEHLKVFHDTIEEVVDEEVKKVWETGKFDPDVFLDLDGLVKDRLKKD